MTLEEAAEYVHVPANDLKHFAQRGEVEGVERNGQWRFDMRSLAEWAQRNLLSSSARELDAHNRRMDETARRTQGGAWSVADFFREGAVELSLSAKAKGGVLRDLAELADASGLCYDKESLFRELVSREEKASTAVGGGCAFPHAHFLDPYMFEAPFVAYARSPRGVFFGGPEGEATRHFFLVCSVDHAMHLRVLARLARLAKRTPLLEALDAVETPAEVIAAVRESERGLKQ